ncbi:MFS transporter [Candidatus Sumerlaeota bacterium]|nr:MFS transporter [Candidatus Sumerlaeota bacterium]
MDDASTRRAALFVSVLSALTVPFMGSATNVAIPVIAREFSMNAVVQSWVPTAYLLAIAACLLPFGKIADIHGRKKIFLCGSALYALSSLLCALAPSSAFLIAGRAAQGAASAMIFGTGVAILTSVYPPGKRGRVLGINTAAVYVGLSCGPFVGGFLTQHAGWRSIFWVNVPMGLLMFASAFSKLKGEWRGAEGERLDIRGAVVYAASLSALMLGLSYLPEPRGVWLVVGGAVGLGAFLWWEGRVASPLLEISLLRRNPVFAFSNLAALLNYSAIFAVGYLMSLYLQNVRSLEPASAGTILVCQPIVMAGCSPIAGRLSDRIEPRFMASAGMGLIVVALLLFARLGLETPVLFVLPPLIVLGLGMGFFSSPNTNAVMGSVEKRHLGVAAATLGTMRSLGQMLSMGVATLALGARLGRASITPDTHPQFVASLHTAFLIFAGLCVVGMFASLARGRMR